MSRTVRSAAWSKAASPDLASISALSRDGSTSVAWVRVGAMWTAAGGGIPAGC